MSSNVQNSIRPPPLSYADRVKKSQRSDLSAAATAQRPQARSNLSSPSPAGLSAPKVASSSGDLLAKQHGATQVTSDRQASSSPDTVRKATEKRLVEEETSSSNAGPVAGPSSEPVKRVAAPPVVNVWSLRKEQMVRVHSQQPLRTVGPSSRASSSNVKPAILSPPASATLGQPSTPTSVQKDTETAVSSPPNAAVTLSTPTRNEDDADTWVVRPHLAPTAIPLPRLDAMSWPEVGKDPSPQASSLAQTGEIVVSEKEERNKKETQGGGQRRGELIFSRNPLVPCVASIVSRMRFILKFVLFCRGRLYYCIVIQELIRIHQAKKRNGFLFRQKSYALRQMLSVLHNPQCPRTAGLNHDSDRLTVPRVPQLPDLTGHRRRETLCKYLEIEIDHRIRTDRVNNPKHIAELRAFNQVRDMPLQGFDVYPMKLVLRADDLQGRTHHVHTYLPVQVYQKCPPARTLCQLL
jgi:hypothetical protein